MQAPEKSALRRVLRAQTHACKVKKVRDASVIGGGVGQEKCGSSASRTLRARSEKNSPSSSSSPSSCDGCGVRVRRIRWVEGSSQRDEEREERGGLGWIVTTDADTAHACIAMARQRAAKYGPVRPSLACPNGRECVSQGVGE
jgi:hypothetical protein